MQLNKGSKYDLWFFYPFYSCQFFLFQVHRKPMASFVTASIPADFSRLEIVLIIFLKLTIGSEKNIVLRSAAIHNLSS